MHPLALFKYCPKCGSPRFVENNFKSKRCEDCGFVYYFNSMSAVAVFITDEADRLLVAVRDREPAKGTFDLPGGFVDMFETGEQAAIREVLEETGIKVAKPQYLFSLPNIYPYSGFDVHTLDMFYQCRVASNVKLKADDDVAALQFTARAEIKPENFGLTSVRNAIKIWLSNNY
ncbi:MAG: NUDIX domain-containing protein [Dysgonamonadaceae bacterium]|jgi:8-oxo-dGTP pyrophosphatase MutT (NUDIX family)|nr:NUDIX domain-containing protein [Dysgonamonadaceae bacterium]